MLDATRRITDGIERIDGLRLLGRPDMNLVAFTSDQVSVFHIIDEMKQRGWYIQPQLGFHGSKENVHLSINPASAKWVDDFLRDLRECTQIARSLEGDDVAESMRDALASLQPGQLTPDALADLLRMVGVDGVNLPERMAGINALLNAMPAELTEEVLTEYVNQLFHYRPERS